MHKLEELMTSVLVAERKKAESAAQVQFMMSVPVLRATGATKADVDQAQQAKQAADNACTEAWWAYYSELDRMVWSGERPL